MNHPPHDTHDEHEWDGSCEHTVSTSLQHNNSRQLPRGIRFEGKHSMGTQCLLAVHRGHLEVLQWARADGCPWDSRTSASAAEGGHLEASPVGARQRLSIRHYVAPPEQRRSTGSAGHDHIWASFGTSTHALPQRKEAFWRSCSGRSSSTAACGTTAPPSMPQLKQATSTTIHVG